MSLDYEKIVSNILKKEDYIILSYLFGSYARGDMNSLSDLDVGVLYAPEIDSHRKYEHSLKLSGELASACKINKIDIIDMEKSSVLLNYNIIKNGKILKSLDENKRIEFETRIISRYLDEKFHIERHNTLALKSIALRGLV